MPRNLDAYSNPNRVLISQVNMEFLDLYVSGKSFDEIAMDCNKSRAQVRAAIRRAFAQIMKAWFAEARIGKPSKRRSRP
jgi:hypothetical protein